MSAADVRTVKTEKGDIKYDGDMPVKALKGLFGAATDSNIDGIIEALSAFVIDWPFEGEPSDPKAWDDLRRTEFNAVVKGVMEDLGSLGEG